MAEGQKIGAAYVDIGADLSNFDAAVAALPRKAGARMAEAMQVLQSKATQVKLELGVAYKAGDLAAQQRLLPIQDQLRAKIDAVTAAATRQAQALQDAARAQVAAAQQATAAQQAATQQAAARQAAGAAVPRGLTDAQMAAITKAGGDVRLAGLAGMPAGLDRLGEAGTKAGERVRAGGMNGAMGLMILSQTIDDAQYGFRSIVNNIPMLGMALGNALGVGAEAGMKFGAIAGIAGVAINLLLTHWDKLMDAMGFGKIRTEAEEMEELGKKANKTAEEIDRLNKFTREQKGIERIHGLESDEQREARSKVEHVFGEAGTGDVRGMLAKPFERKLMPDEEAAVKAAGDAAADAEMAKLRTATAGAGGGNMPVLGAPRAPNPADLAAAQAAAEERRQKAMEEASKAITDKIRNEALKKADELMFRAGAVGPEGKATRGEIDAILKRQGRVQLAAKLEQASPEAIRAEKDRAEDVAARREGAEREVRETNRRQEQLDKRREREASRMVGPLQRTVGEEMLRSPLAGQEFFETRIQAALKAAGVAADDIGKLSRDIYRQLKERTEHALQERIGSGMAKDVAEAREQVLKEERGRDKADRIKAGGKAEVLSTESYLNKLLVAGLDSGDKAQISKQQLDEAKAGNKLLDRIAKALDEQKPAVARFARGPAA